MLQFVQFTMKLAVTIVLGAAATADVYDLGDITGGGNGTGNGQYGLGIRPQDGTAVAPDHWGGWTTHGSVFTPTDGSNGTANLPYVDGVLLPRGVTQISSSGLTFSFPSTGGMTYDAIRSGVAYVHSQSGTWPINLEDQFGTSRPGVGFHANAGITYDLQELRAAGLSFDAVSGMAGFNREDSVVPSGNLEIWVLVDGVQRYRQYFAPGVRMYESFSIPLDGADHFLTFASTDYNSSNTGDHAVIADAMLVPEPSAALLAGAAIVFLFRRGGR